VEVFVVEINCTNELEALHFHSNLIHCE
jgi:hypothetical protein